MTTLESAYIKCIQKLEDSTNMSFNCSNTLNIYYELESLMKAIGTYEGLEEQIAATVFCLEWIRDFICNKTGIFIDNV